MDFDLLNSSPEAQLELMNTMLQLEQLTALTEQPPPSPMQPPAHFSPGPYTACATGQEQLMAAGNSYPDVAVPLCGGIGIGGGGGDAMREMIFHIAALQPVSIEPEAVRPPKRRNVRISKDPQSVAARLRRERISERIRILQRLVPGGTKMDTASMLDEAIHYVKFLKAQVQSLERAAAASAGLAGAYPGLNIPW